MEFSENRFLIAEGKNAGNPVGLPSILTHRKRKSASENQSSDYSLLVTPKESIFRENIMKRVLSCIVLLCFILSSLGLVGLAEGEKTYRVAGTFAGAGAEAPVSIFVLKDGYTMEDLASSTGSVLDKVYYTNIFTTTTGGAYSFDISVPREALDAQCVLSCNGQIKQDLLRRFLVSYGDFKVLYAAPSAASSPDGTEAKPYSVGTTLINKLKTETNNGYDVDVRLKGGRYGFQNFRVQMIDVNVDGNGSMTFLPATKDDKVTFTSMKTISHSYINKVTSGEILERVPEIAKNNLYEIDPVAAGINSDQLTMLYSGASADRPLISPPVLYVNGKAQRMSQYPNEDTIQVNEQSCTGTDASGNKTISLNYSTFDHIDISKWENAVDDAYITGFIFDSYRANASKIVAIDKANKKISLDAEKSLFYTSEGVWYTGYSYYGPRITIVNLPEEMDIPGEYYLDVDAKKIYYFASEEITPEDKFEMANDSGTYPNLLFIQKAKNITFRDIEFYGNRPVNDSLPVMLYVSYADNVRFINCDIHATARKAVSAPYVTNFVVEGCNIYDTGGSGVAASSSYKTATSNGVTYAWGINVKTSAGPDVSSGIVIRNNHAYNTSTNPTLGSDGQAFRIESPSSKTIGGIVENNLIHNNRFIGGVCFNALRTSVRRNEIYNMLHSVDDAGVIYTGRSLTEFGNTISENYIHSFSALSPARYANMAVYLDDHMSGQTVERNIIKTDNPTRSALIGMRSVGYDNVFRGNIFIDIYYGARLATRTNIAFGDGTDDHNLYAGLTSSLPASDYERYQDMVNFKAELDKTSTKKMRYKTPTTYNIAVGVTEPVSAQRTSTTDPTVGYNTSLNVGNITNATSSVFVNPNDQNYVIKASSAAAGTAYSVAPNEKEGFSMDLIGTQIDVPFVDHEFNLLYPANEKTIEKENLVLTWEQANFSDRYDYVIARDSAFTNIVEQGSTKFNFVVPTENYTDGTYYWKVTAVNESRDMGRSWTSEEAYQTFTIGEELDLTIVDTALKTSDGATTLATLKNVKDFDVNCTIKNNTNAEKTFIIISALFNAEGKQVQARITDEPVTLAGGATVMKTLEFFQSTAIATDGYYVKTFVLAAPKGYAPLSFFYQKFRK